MKVVLIDGDSLFYGICFGKFNQFAKKEKSRWDIREFYSHLDSWMEDIIKKTKATHYLAFWSKGKVFRHNIDPNYKAGRPEDKPLFFDDLRRYFRDKWKGIAIDGLEAEDLVAVYATHYKNTGIDYHIARIDHDLDQLEGNHYDFKKDVLYSISSDESWKNLYRQILTGCPTDSVKGLKSIGYKKADKILEGLSVYDLPQKVCDTYIKYEGWEIGNERFKEVFSLIFLLRHTIQIKHYTGIDYILQEPYYFSTVSPNMFMSSIKPVNNNDLPDFLK